MKKPLVSVGLQFFNNEKTLYVAIKSVLDQSFGDFELLLYNDGSFDKSMEIAYSFRDPRIRYFNNEINRKRSSCINECLFLAKGKYYAFMDGDDIAYPDRLLKQVDYLEKNPSVDLLGTGMLIFNNVGNPIGKRVAVMAHEAICARPWSGFPMAQPTFMGRIEWFRRYLYRKEGIRCEDQDLLLRSYRFSRFANLPEILMGYREDKIQLRKILKGRWYFSQIMLKEFFRQRQLGLCLRAPFEQAVKGLVDCIAVTSGLNYRLLQHRAKPITYEERQEWERVWQSVNTDEEI